jgi:hypothetical protein
MFIGLKYSFDMIRTLLTALTLLTGGLSEEGGLKGAQKNRARINDPRPSMSIHENKT